MKILIHSAASGDSAGIAYLMAQEGAEVYLYIKDSTDRRQMDGILTKVPTLEEGLRKRPDFVIFDYNGDGAKADQVRKAGFPVIGGSALADKLELDRVYGTSVAKQYGIKVPKTTEFSSPKEAIEFVKKEKKGFAIKLDDKKSDATSYVAKSAEEMIDYLSYNQEEGKIKEGERFILQEVVKGAEISTELWFSSGVPVYPANSTFETKKFLAGELGQRTGCEVSHVFHYANDSSRIVERTIRKLFPLLKYSKWTGPIDINCIVSEVDHEPYFLEWTPRIGYSAIFAFISILGIPISNFFSQIATGGKGISYRALWGTSLKLTIPPYPVEIEEKKVMEEVYAKTQGLRVGGSYGKDFLPIDVLKNKHGLVVAGVSAIVGECLGRGNTLMESWRAAQKVFESVEIPNKQGRLTDGAEDTWKRILKLKSWGYDIPSPSGEKKELSGVR